QRVSTIEQLQRDRTGGQELLDMVANTVSRTENLWLTEMIRKGNTLSMEGSSASINAVANFITALKRSGYFQKVEIKETKQDEKNAAVQSFVFQISAEITPPAAVQTRPANAPAPGAAAKAPAKKGQGDAMANPFRDMSVIMQALVAAPVAVVLVLVGVYVPASPIARERDEVDSTVPQLNTL